MSSKRPLEDFYLNTPDDEAVYEAVDATTVDDSYLAHLSERLAQRGGQAPPEVGPSPAEAPAEASARDDIADVAIGPAGVVPVAGGSDLMEVGDSDLVAIDEPLGGGPPGGLEDDALDEPLKPRPSDLLQSVPPPPDEEPLLDPQLDPATYDAPTFVRPSVIEQDPAPVLEIVQGNERGRAYRLEKPATSVGRGLDNDIVLTDIAVSRRHMRFLRDGMQVSVQDLGSGNGTMLNGGRVGTAVVSLGDRVEVGNSVFRVVFPGQDSFPAAAPSPIQPPPTLAGPVHQRATAFIDDGQQLREQVGVATPPPAVHPTLPPVQQAADTDGVSLRRAGARDGLPFSFKVAMAALAGFVVLIGVVGLVAAVLHARNRAGERAAAESDQPAAAELFAEGRAAYLNERWGQAADAFERVLALSPDNADAQAFLAQARLEERNQGTLEAAKQALAEENYEDALYTIKTIPQASVYAGRARDAKQEAEQRQSAALVVEARRLQAEGDSEAARARLEQALQLNPANGEARGLQQQLAGTAPTMTSPGASPAAGAGVAVASLEPGEGPQKGTRPPRTTGRDPTPPPTTRPTKSTKSSGLSQVVAAFKRGRFGEAAEQARELAASASSEEERSEARSLAMRIERFEKAWSGVQAGGSARQKMSNLESALRLDKQISGGHFAPSIEPKLRETYEGNASRAWRAGQYASACQSALQALKLDRAASIAADISSKCDSKAREYFEEGERLQRSDLTQAKSYWRKVLNMVPRASTWYTRAYSALNNAGRGRSLDEDE